MIRTGFTNMNESKIPDKYREKLVALAEKHPKEFEKLNSNQKRLKALGDLVDSKGFEALAPYAAEYKQILDENKRLISILEKGTNIIAGYGILSLASEDL